MSPDNFKQWRNSMELTQIFAGELLGVSRVTIQNWENGSTRIPAAIEIACEAHLRRWRMRFEFGPVTLTYFDAPLWQPVYGPISVPRVSRELYRDNGSAINRVCDLRKSPGLHNPLILAESGEIIWGSMELEQECEKRQPAKRKSSSARRAI